MEPIDLLEPKWDEVTPFTVKMSGTPAKALAIIDWLDEQGWTTTVYTPLLAPFTYLGGKRGRDMTTPRSQDQLRIAREDWRDSITKMWFEDFQFESKALAVAFKLRFDGEDE